MSTHFTSEMIQVAIFPIAFTLRHTIRHTSPGQLWVPCLPLPRRDGSPLNSLAVGVGDSELPAPSFLLIALKTVPCRIQREQELALEEDRQAQRDTTLNARQSALEEREEKTVGREEQVRLVIGALLLH